MGDACGTDAERADICPYVNNAIIRMDIIEPVLRDVGDLADWGIMNKELYRTIRG
jgi:hypothetical protein